MFLWESFFVWKALGRPKHTSPDIGYAKIKYKVEIPKQPNENSSRRNSLGMEKYPLYRKLSKKNLEKPKPSPRYGDFNVETHRKHYLDGHCYPHRDVQTGGNLTRNRTDQMPGSSRAADQNDNVEEAISYEVTEEIDFNYNLHSKPIRQPKHEIHFDREKFYKSLDTELGTLYLNKKGLEDNKWRRRQDGTPVIRRNFTKYPPILIPSRGRSRTALLNLSDAMKHEKYYEIVGH